MEFAQVFEPLNQNITQNDPITITVTGISKSCMQMQKSLTMLGHYLHDVLNVPYGQIIVLLGLEDRENVTDSEMEDLVGSYLYKKCTVIRHDASHAGFLAGRTRKGREVTVNPVLIRRKVILAGDNIRPVTGDQSLKEEEIMDALDDNVEISLKMNISDEEIRKDEMIRQLDYFKTIRRQEDPETEMDSWQIA